MIRVAVIGLGNMGLQHARLYREIDDTELVALVDIDWARAEEASRAYGGTAYTSYADMLERERPAAVSVAVPTEAHYVICRHLLTAGCHVLLEKPIAAKVKEAWELIALAEQSGRLLMVGHVERFNPAVIELKRRVSAGELGRIFQLYARRLGPLPRRSEVGGVVIDLATHDLDVMRYITESEVTRVYGETSREIYTSDEDLVAGLLRFANGTVGVLEINWLTPTKVRELRATGERGMFHLDYLKQELCFFENGQTDRRQPALATAAVAVPIESATCIPLIKQEPLRAELEAFIRALHGQASPVPSGFDAVTALSLALELCESARSHQVRTPESLRLTHLPS